MEPVSAPVGPDAVPPVPHGKTALRLEWKFLPPEVRALVEDELGAPVVEADSRTSGFTPGFASVVTGADGSTMFVKAANKVAQVPPIVVPVARVGATAPSWRWLFFTVTSRSTGPIQVISGAVEFASKQ